MDGQCVWQAEHNLWGKTSIVFHKSQDFNALPVADCNLRFLNQWEDNETGLYYNLNRYYDPDSGQYLSKDPIGLEGGLRTHGYVHDPVQCVDPSGLAGCSTESGQSVGQLRQAGMKDAHHVIQDAAVRDLPGYKTNEAPGVQLKGPSNVSGTPHYEATQVQRQAGGGTYGAERRIGYKAIRRAGYSSEDARSEISRADEYFKSLEVGPNTPTRIPGNRF